MGYLSFLRIWHGTLLGLLLLAQSAGAQYTKEYNPWPVVTADTVPLPFWGGVNNPKPSLADFDGDGLVDLFVGEIRGKLAYFQNTGSSTAPEWTPITERLGDLDVGTWHSFCDIDADGDLDLFVDSRVGATVYYRNETVDTNISFVLVDSAFGGFVTGQNNTCDFADIDNDGDFDFFFGNLAGGLSLWRNVGDSAAPLFLFETDFYDSILAFPGGLAAAEPEHGFSTVQLADIDGDNDQEVFYGDIFNFNLYFFRNLGTPLLSDLQLESESFLPTATQGFNHTAFADLDADFDLDLVVGAANSEDLDNLIFMRNDGSPSAASYTVVDYNLVKSVDVGSFAVPEFGDLDADGDYDLLLGGGAGGLWHFENVGLPTAPSFLLTDTLYKGIDVGLSAAPLLVDLDGDFDLDLLIGTEAGRIEHWRNDGSVGDFVPVLVTNQMAGIQVDRLAVPRTADLNDDGLLDLVVGEWDFNGFANLRLYQNIGTPTAPEFALVSFKLLPETFRDFTLPQIRDWDHDGRLDLILGGRFFGQTLFRNTTPVGTFPDSTTLVSQADTLPGSDDGYRLAITFADIDSDGDADVFVGEEDGGLNFYRRDGGTPFLRGDVNATGVIDAADVIYLVNHTFKAGPPPLPVDSAGDVNCDLTITAADVIYLVNFAFKSGPAPCLL